MKLFSIEIPVFATAYIKAETAKEAREKAKSLGMTELLCTDGMVDDRPFEHLMRDDGPHTIITLSPAMTAHAPPEGAAAELVFDPSDKD